jgi:hypothetical protein
MTLSPSPMRLRCGTRMASLWDASVLVKALSTQLIKPEVRHAISAFTKIAGVDEGLGRLAQDLADGTWHRRYGHLQHLDELDLGYRIVINRRTRRVNSAHTPG